MDSWDELYISIVLKYVKKNNPTLDEFQNYVDRISYGSEIDMHDHESVFRTKKMISAGDADNTLALTGFGEMILKDIQSKRRIDTVQILVPIIALAITTGTLVYSIVLGF